LEAFRRSTRSLNLIETPCSMFWKSNLAACSLHSSKNQEADAHLKNRPCPDDAPFDEHFFSNVSPSMLKFGGLLGNPRSGVNFKLMMLLMRTLGR